MGITYSAGSPELSMWTDASWGRLDKDFGGYIIMLGGACISASSNQQTGTSKIKEQSSPESELNAHCNGCKGLVFQQDLLECLSLKLKLPARVRVNPNPALTLRPPFFCSQSNWCKLIRRGNEQ